MQRGPLELAVQKGALEKYLALRIGHVPGSLSDKTFIDHIKVFDA